MTESVLARKRHRNKTRKPTCSFFFCLICFFFLFGLCLFSSSKFNFFFFVFFIFFLTTDNRAIDNKMKLICYSCARVGRARNLGLF